MRICGPQLAPGTCFDFSVRFTPTTRVGKCRALLILHASGPGLSLAAECLLHCCCSSSTDFAERQGFMSGVGGPDGATPSETVFLFVLATDGIRYTSLS